jgi:hypothetical protein
VWPANQPLAGRREQMFAAATALGLAPSPVPGADR